jgi:hypothetical protein
MRQPRRGAPIGRLLALLALLLPLLVSGGLGGSTATTLLHRHTTVVKAAGEHQPLSHQVPPDRRRHSFTTGFTATGGGGHPAATRLPDARYLSLAPGFDWRPAGDDDSRSLAAPLVKPGRAPPPTGS